MNGGSPQPMAFSISGCGEGMTQLRAIRPCVSSNASAARMDASTAATSPVSKTKGLAAQAPAKPDLQQRDIRRLCWRHPPREWQRTGSSTP